MSDQCKSTFDHSGSNSDRTFEEQGTLDKVDAAEGIQQGLEDARQGKTRPTREFFAEFEDTHDGLQSEMSLPLRTARNRSKLATVLRGKNLQRKA